MRRDLQQKKSGWMTQVESGSKPGKLNGNAFCLTNGKLSNWGTGPALWRVGRTLSQASEPLANAGG